MDIGYLKAFIQDMIESHEKTKNHVVMAEVLSVGTDKKTVVVHANEHLPIQMEMPILRGQYINPNIRAKDKGLIIVLDYNEQGDWRYGRCDNVVFLPLGRSDSMGDDAMDNDFHLDARTGKIDIKNDITDLKEQLNKMIELIGKVFDDISNAIKNGATAPNDGGATYKTAMISALAMSQVKQELSMLKQNVEKLLK